MFGYVRAFKPQMRICEFDTYKAVYCGLCKQLGKKYGFVCRMTLSYDFTFLALLSMAIYGVGVSAKKERCIAHPLKKSMCLCAGNELDYTAAVAVITIYHKINDDRMDKDLKKKIVSFCLLPFIKKAYKKAYKLYPLLADKIKEQMVLQSDIEKQLCGSIDKASEPTAEIMSLLAGEITDNEQDKRLLERFGYLLGRYIYLCDALDDLPDDIKKNEYNPLAVQYNLYKNKDNFNDDLFLEIKEYASDSVQFTLGELANVYVLLDIKKYKTILDNIIYLGLKNTFGLILKGEYKNEKKGEK